MLKLLNTFNGSISWPRPISVDEQTRSDYMQCYAGAVNGWLVAESWFSSGESPAFVVNSFYSHHGQFLVS